MTAAIISVTGQLQWYFAWCPYNKLTRKNEAWKTFFTRFQKKLGGKTGEDIWRFKIPALVKRDETEPTGVCLTGNFGEWDY